MWLHSSNVSEAPISGEQVSYSPYNVTLSEALNVQMKQLQQTDKYLNAKAYVAANAVNVYGEIFSTGNVNLRSEPKLGSEYVKHSVPPKTTFMIVKEVIGDYSNGINKWYEIVYQGESLYVHAPLVKLTFSRVKLKTTNVLAEANSTAHVYGQLTLNSTRNIVTMGETWHEIKYDAWRNPTQDDVLSYLDPNNNSIWQHLDLSAVVNVSDNELNSHLIGKGILEQKGKSFNDGAKAHSINVFYLISHALLETGHGKSDLSTGKISVGMVANNKWAIFLPDKTYTAETVVVNGKTNWRIEENGAILKDNVTNVKNIYNMFGIEAVDSHPDIRGAVRAYQEKWFTPEEAIVGGAKFVGARYIHNEYKQNTLYKMRWNPANPGYPQYATDIGWAVKQVNQIKKFYDQMETPLIHFDVPVYK